ncbi:DUF5336 domain-containing protein [Streptomyces cavernicola]|uniref:DUF5336 domain-containing protein n=1 Tax=Streptomyces cavernicola TaxID=3043613 RepID=A0ABT6SF34_9ACTN|nr:DUF5336 domain-containing protein [Streptomyces sp. B-S-A6]MDI3405911.1 DUF5336 domain-containing protein [Streptomyces sp. B-S-A6]
MNFRSLTRGDAVVIGAAVLLFIASFLNTSSGDSPYTVSPWEFLGNAIGLYMVGVIGAALIVVNRALPQPKKVVGIELGHIGIVLTVAVAWQFFWTILDASGAGPAIILGLIAALVLAGAAVATPLVPALNADLMGAPKPQPMYGGQPQQGGYGYPGSQQGQPYPGQQQPSYGGQQVPGQQQAAPQDQGAQPQAQAQAQAPAGGDFAPFWFAVPVQRPLYAEDGNPTPIAELAPGTWYLAVEQRGPGLVAQTQDGRRGVLQDTTGIQRG